MNNHEFKTLGVLLFGNTWKRELAGALGISPTSNTIARISKAETSVSMETEENLISFVEKKSKLLSAVADYLKNKVTIPFEYCKNNVISFDHDGIKEWVNLEDMQLGKNGVYLNNAKIMRGYSNEVFFNSMIVSSIYDDFIDFDKKLIENFIIEKFDLRLIGGVVAINRN